MGKLEYRQEGLAEMKPVIRESGGIDGVHYLSLMTLLIELVWEKGKTAMRRRSGHISQDGGLVHEDGKAVLAGAGGVGPGGATWGRPGSGRATNPWSSTWGTEGGYTKWCGKVGNDSEAIDRCTGTRYNPSMIRSFRHRGLRRLYERGDPSRIGADQLDRITLALADLDAASKPSELDLPAYRLHPLRGDRKGLWSISISGNWRVTFRFEDGDVYDVDLIDYH